MVLMENDNRMASRIHGRLGDNTVAGSMAGNTVAGSMAGNTIAGSMADRPDLKGWIQQKYEEQ